METNRELSPVSEEPDQTFDESSCISIMPSPVSTKPNPSFDESSPGFELSPTSTEPNPSFDDSSAVSIDPSPSTSERTPNTVAMSLASIELKAISDTNNSVEPTHNSVEMSLGSTERNARFKDCLSVTSTTNSSRKSNQALSHAPKPSGLAIVPPPSLSRLLTVLPPSSKSKIPVNLTYSRHRSGCDSSNFSLTMAHKFCTLRSILKCGQRDYSQSIGLHHKVEPDVSTDSQNSKINMNFLAFFLF